ncbi:arylamine N-acetyltransferase family protein [Pseudonocardia sp. TRM90224]|uniref:arylamine N-acetyltransferase family protein n=1 Tax=Pseudonocardia sp. TRM90224 TaxID=2812678 RepID=UPI001E4A4918|nr:arylamine N-acetyltransferase [Pseudonocardia sp. TRM90224]
MDVDAYLARINAARPAAPTVDALTELMRAHIRNVPFENYDIVFKVPLSLAVDDLFDKVVRRGRGGFCYELNGLFAELLRELDYEVTLVSAFDVDADGRRGPDFEHLRLVVGTEAGPMIVDIGNGARWDRPVPLRVGEHGHFRVEHDGEVWWTATRGKDGQWEREWSWTAQPRELAEFTERCRFQETDPGSHFSRTRRAVIAVDGGRIGLRDGVFSETGRPDRVVGTDEEYALLKDRFGITLKSQWVVYTPVRPA